MSNVKYVAEGFVNDSEKILNDFVRENSTNFTVFATKWKEHNFGLIFSGRDKQELQEFTHEIYQLTLEYLQNTSFILQVGAVYLLYALYRNQPSTPPVRIRIALRQWEVIKKQKVLAEKNCYMHLHYVINFLFANAFDFVAHPILHGPCTSRGRMVVEKPTLPNSFFVKDCKTAMTNFHRSNILAEIRDLGKEYIDLRAKVFPSGDNEIINVSDINEYINCLERIVHDGPYSRKRFRNKSVSDINLGSRRANIKANQYERKALFRKLNPSDSDEDYKPETAVKVENQGKRHARKRRMPKNKRRVGRPKKFEKLMEKLMESDGNESECSLKQRGLYKRRGPISKSSYLENYELDIPTSSKMIRDFFTTETSEDESSDSKETFMVKTDVLSNNSEDEVDNSFIKKENSGDQEDNFENQESNKDNAISDASNSDSDASNEIGDLYF